MLSHRWKFIIIFFSTYVAQFCTFALIYLAFPGTCTHGIDGNFAHALWMSSRTASTIGFNQVSLGKQQQDGTTAAAVAVGDSQQKC